ncbi:hypothetical protein LLG95_00420 [bacterium]|nr:hypothetical protein [bacterium]
MTDSPSKPVSRDLTVQTFAVFLVVSLLYWAFRSKGLDDYDSVQFAFGVKQFNLFAHTPHPPGYPLYIFAGKVLGFVGMDAPKALTLVSCLGGGLFTASWFFICARRFGRGLAFVLAAALMLAPMQWMTATKVLTDAPASALIAVELAVISIYHDQRSFKWLALAAIAGAIGAGIRPQNIGVLLLILIVGLAWVRAGWRHWAGALLVFLIANLLWLIPVLWSQSILPEGHGSWLTYPRQLLHQWQWRLDKPAVYIGAGDWSAGFLYRYVLDHTLKVWFEYGFGWKPRSVGGLAGLALYFGGMWLYIRRGLIWEHASFWRLHLIWAVVYFVMVFSFLPAAVRYQLPILPLLLLPAIAGLWSLQNQKRWIALALPVMLFLPSADLIAQNHNDLAPPIKAVRYLNKKYPEKERGKVMLFLASARRHAEWYGPGYRIDSIDNAAKMGDAVLSHSLAIYTDEKDFVERTKWRNVKLVRLKQFKRSVTIHHKHDRIVIYQVVRT